MIDRNLSVTGWLVPVATAMVAFAPVAWAQPGGALDAAIVRSTTPLTDAQRQQVAQYAQAHAAGLANATQPTQIMDSRRRLLEPLGDEQVGTPFRLEYARVVLPSIRPLVASDSDIVAANAIVIAGELATQDSVALLEDAWRVQRAPVRFEVAVSYRRLFETLRRTPPAILDTQVAAIVQSLAPKMASAQDPLVLEGLLRAAIAAGNLDAHRSAALCIISDGLGAAVTARGDQTDGAFLQALATTAAGVRDMTTLQQRLSPEAAKCASSVGGHVIAHIVRVIDRKPAVRLSDAERSMAAQAAAAAQAAIGVAGRALDTSFAPSAKPVGNQLTNANAASDAEFLLNAIEVVGPQGTLTRAPFGFAAGMFLKR